MLQNSIAKTITYLVLFMLIISIVIYKFINSPNDWSKKEPLTFLEAFYFTSTTLSSTGYGDLSPVSKRARVFTIITQFVTIFGFIEIVQEYIGNRVVTNII